MFVLIHGPWPTTTDREPNEYVEHIVYGTPERVVTVRVRDSFVALVEWKDGDSSDYYTFQRMGSFPYGAMQCGSRQEALYQFGAWVYHYAPKTASPVEAR